MKAPITDDLPEGEKPPIGDDPVPTSPYPSAAFALRSGDMVLVQLDWRPLSRTDRDIATQEIRQLERETGIRFVILPDGVRVVS